MGTEALKDWCKEVIATADSNVHRSRRHREQAAAQDREAPAVHWQDNDGAPVSNPASDAPSAVPGEDDDDDDVEIVEENGDVEIERLFDWNNAVEIDV